VAGGLVGVFLDKLTARWGATVANLCLPLLVLPAYAGMLFFMILLYRSWKRNGGDAAYTPPAYAAADSFQGEEIPVTVAEDSL
jgi:hypothetical protein